MYEIVTPTLVSLATAVIGYLLKENHDLKKENRFMMVSLLHLTSALEHADLQQNGAILHQTAKEIKEELRSKLNIRKTDVF